MTTKCKSCGSDIVWALTSNGKRIPLNAQEDLAAGNVLLTYGDPRDTPRAEVVLPGLGRYISHFVTCPDADKFRNDRGAL